MVEFTGGPGTWVTRTYTAARNAGAFCNGKPIQASQVPGWLLWPTGPVTGSSSHLNPPPRPVMPPPLPPTPRAQVSKAHDVAQSLLVTGFGYEHDECWQQNMALFRHFTDVSQGVRRLGSAAIDMCHVACGALSEPGRGARVKRRGRWAGVGGAAGGRRGAAQSACPPIHPPPPLCCTSTPRHLRGVLGVPSQALGHGCRGAGGGGGGRHRHHHGRPRLLRCACSGGGCAALHGGRRRRKRCCLALRQHRAVPAAAPHAALLLVCLTTPAPCPLPQCLTAAWCVSNGFIHDQLLAKMEPCTAKLVDMGIDLSQWYVPKGYRVHSGSQLD